MYISLANLCFGILFILGIIALVIFIMVLIKLFSFLARVNGLIKRNEKNVDEILISLPKATKNFLELSDNLKAVGEVIAETAVTVIETKQHLEGYTDVFIDILKIVTLVFTKKKNNISISISVEVLFLIKSYKLKLIGISNCYLKYLTG